MPDHSYDASGTDNLRANPSIFGPASAPATAGSGEDVGGKENLRAQALIMEGPNKTAGKGSNDTPAQTFSDHQV